MGIQFHLRMPIASNRVNAIFGTSTREEVVRPVSFHAYFYQGQAHLLIASFDF